MKEENWAAENPAETMAEKAHCASMGGIGNIKNVLADKLHTVAETISKKADSPGANPEVARYGRQASDMLEESAEYLRQLDYQQTEAAIRNYVKENPGRSLVIAGIAGLAIGAWLRRR